MEGAGPAATDLIRPRHPKSVYYTELERAILVVGSDTFGCVLVLGHGDSMPAAIRDETPNAKVLTTARNVRDGRAVADWYTESGPKLGPIHGSVNAAGIAPPSHFVTPIDEVPDEDWERTIGINLTGLMLCMREQVRAMKKSKASGSVVNITSTADLSGFANGGPYSAAKWGVNGLTWSVAKETAKSGVRITRVAP
ncbi:hypothetical protein QQZ08_003036 [Neonectria magnoliae]|uniref:Uncharacterized protein n=1 Tax=Neonectria magnoliae TaxID=2732573 RepID=A0ABR1ICI6_9HYPO